MPLFVLEKEFAFPPVHLAEPDGLLAVGGDLSVDRLLIAYSKASFHGMKANIYCGGALTHVLFYFQVK